MGVKDWMLLRAEGDVRSILQSAPPIDRAATRALVARLYPEHQLVEIDDGNLLENPNPADPHVYAGCFPSLTVVCASEVGIDRPSRLDRRFRGGTACGEAYLHAMRSDVDWFAYAIWDAGGALRRSLSLCPEFGIMEDLGEPLPFETPYWAGDRTPGADDGRGYPLPFRPMAMGEDALLALFGFTFHGERRDGDPDPEKVVLAGFTLRR